MEEYQTEHPENHRNCLDPDQESDHAHTHEHAHGHGHAEEHTHAHNHPNQKAVSNRLARAIGHLEAVKRMVDNGEDCAEILIQMAAVRSAINNAGKILLMDHIDHCIVDAVKEGDMSQIDELNEAISKFL